MLEEDTGLPRGGGWQGWRKRSGWIILLAGCFLILPGATLAGLACLSNPCINGVCIDDLNSTYSCYCIDGYTGVECQTNWDECWSSPCKNGGTCIDGIAEFNCTCPEGFVGLECEEDFDECDSNPCHNNGTCVDAPNGYQCSCLPGYLGDLCEFDVAVCNLTEETRCSNGGLCIEGLGMAFTCKCALGWEGKLCDIPINECDSSPCQNGGLCIDQHADYLCACTFGFTGKSCESQIELCANNTCTNKALCMMEDTIRVCYCVPDFHGEKCQFQYDECLLSPNRCLNGGTCIDGVDNFTCSCPPRLTGILCECLILDDEELDCEYVSPTPLTADETPSMTSVTPSWTPTPHSSTFMGSEGTTLNGVTVFNENNFTDQSSTPLTTTVDESTVTFVPTHIWDQSTYTTIDNIYSTTLSQSTLPSESLHTITTLTTDSSVLTTVGESAFSETAVNLLNNLTEITSKSSEYTTTEVTTADINELQTRFYETTTSKDLTTLLISSTVEYTTINADLTSDKTELTSILNIPTTTALTTSTIEPQTYETSTVEVYSTKGMVSDSTTTESTTSVTELIIPETVGTETATMTTTKSQTDDTTTMSIVITEESKSTTTETQTLPSTLAETTTAAITSLFTETPETTLMTTMSTTDFTKQPFDSSTFLSSDGNNCSSFRCLNGGSCVQSTEGPRCVCKFDFDGPFCENVLGIASAAFSGDSYLTHKLSNMSGIRVQINARTLSSEGLILYSNIGQDTYMCLYMHRGLLKFKFSCGYQTMLLSELKVPINTGYELRIKAVLEMTDGRRHCNASLHINDTLAMSGGQVAAPTSYPPTRDSWLHLGAVPESFGVIDHSPPETAPFTGCMNGLLLDGKSKHIFKDASDGFEITECSSLACLSNPCINGGSCNDIGERWTCSCANGYLGQQCERSVCEINPCQFGGTCVVYPGSGYLCLCPLGKHGMFCEHNLEIAQPSFSSMVGGLSSFAAYPLPLRLINHGMEMRFKIQPQNMEQISLLAFLGQPGSHDPKSDHLAVTFVKGYIMLTWNLGNGPRRIFTSRPITGRGNRPHLIKVGRFGRAAWLSVDNMPNITGNAPGNLLQLDVVPLLYLGGHESANFTTLPHDLPLHGGFSGCISDLWVGGAGGRSGGGVIWAPTRGRAVGQCSVTQCHPMVCHNGGACMHHAATYSCLCSGNWYGPLCMSEQNPCDSAVHKCSSGSTCVPTVMGYQCECSLGKAGVYCDRNVELSDVSFSGTRSYLRLKTISLGDIHFSLEFEVRPLHPKGVVFFTETHDGCFVSLTLQGGLLEYRWAGLDWGGKPSGSRVVVVVRSGVVLSLGAWHSVRAGRYGRKLFLWVDGTMTTETLATHQSFSAFNTSVYIGGVKDLSTLPFDVMSGPPMSFTGCVRKLIINSQRLPLNTNFISESRNADDCDGDVCGGDVCWNGGTCLIVQELGKSVARCVCPPQYMGDHCMELQPCQNFGCNRGKCVQQVCVCPAGWGGYTCQNQIKIDTPQFSGNSFMIMDEGKIKISNKQRSMEKMRYKRNVNHIYMNFTTANPDGLLLWSEMKNQKYVSIGLEGGYLKISWMLPKLMQKLQEVTTADWQEPFHETEVIKVLQAGRLSNGDWHTLDFRFEPGNISLITDSKIVYEETGLKYQTNDQDLIMYIGGFPLNISTRRHTKGLYASNFVGCVSEVNFESEKYIISNFSHFESENIEVCQLFS